MVTLYIHSGMQLLTQNQKAIVLVLDMSIQSLATPMLANISVALLWQIAWNPLPLRNV
jgi:hypothetical protein